MPVFCYLCSHDSSSNKFKDPAYDACINTSRCNSKLYFSLFYLKKEPAASAWLLIPLNHFKRARSKQCEWETGRCLLSSISESDKNPRGWISREVLVKLIKWGIIKLYISFARAWEFHRYVVYVTKRNRRTVSLPPKETIIPVTMKTILNLTVYIKLHLLKGRIKSIFPWRIRRIHR